MDEALDVLDVVADAGLEGAVVWLFRLLGLLLVVAGLGAWLLTEPGVVLLPALLIVAGLVLLVVPQVLLAVAELA